MTKRRPRHTAVTALIAVGSVAAIGYGGFNLAVSMAPSVLPEPAPKMALQSGHPTPVPNAADAPLTGTITDTSTLTARHRTSRLGDREGNPTDETFESDMALRIPNLGATLDVGAAGLREGELKTGEKRNMLQLPDDPNVAALASNSAPCDATAGTTVIAAHNHNAHVQRGPGPLYYLADLADGAAAYLTCTNQQTSVWKQTATEFTVWADLDQRLFTKVGARRLAVISCIGVGSTGYNIVKIFEPVQQPQPSSHPTR